MRPLPDYPAHDGRLLVSCGALQPETVLHELLHPVVHPLIQARRELFLRAGARYPGVDPSTYLAGGGNSTPAKNIWYGN